MAGRRNREEPVSAQVPAEATLGVTLFRLDSKDIETIAELQLRGAMPLLPPQGTAEAVNIISTQGSRRGIYLAVYQGSEILDVARLSFMEGLPNSGRKGEVMDAEEEKKSKASIDDGTKLVVVVEKEEGKECELVVVVQKENEEEGDEVMDAEEKKSKALIDDGTKLVVVVEKEKEGKECELVVVVKEKEKEEEEEGEECERSLGKEEEECKKVLGKKEEEWDGKTSEEKIEEGGEMLVLKIWPAFSHAALSIYCGGKWKMTRAYQVEWLYNQDELLGSSDLNGSVAQAPIFTHWRINVINKLEFEGLLKHTSGSLGFNVNSDDFNFCEPLGAGTYGAVYKCYYSNHQCAVKVIDVSAHSDHSEISEVDIMSSLEDESTVTFYQAWLEKYQRPNKESEGAYLKRQNYHGAEERYVFIHMELCKRTLADFIRDENEQTTLEEKWVLFENIAKGVKYIHQRGIIHVDLKPGNIFHGMDGAIKLGDFGHSCWDGMGAKGSGRLGTVYYQAPELTNREETITDKVDICSLGVIYLEIFVRYKDRFNSLWDLMYGRYNTNWPVDLKLLEMLTALDPNDRPSIDEVLESISSKKVKTDGDGDGEEAKHNDESKSEVKEDGQDGHSRKQDDNSASKSKNKEKESSFSKKAKGDGGKSEEAEDSNKSKVEDGYENEYE